MADEDFAEVLIMKLNLPYPISANRYWRNFRGRVTVSDEARAFKNHCAWTARSLGMKPLDGDVHLSIQFHPKTTMAGKASKTRLDLSNTVKVMEDALNGIAYLDDKQIVRITAELADPMPDGGLTVEVNPG